MINEVKKHFKAKKLRGLLLKLMACWARERVDSLRHGQHKHNKRFYYTMGVIPS